MSRVLSGSYRIAILGSVGVPMVWSHRIAALTEKLGTVVLNDARYVDGAVVRGGDVGWHEKAPPAMPAGLCVRASTVARRRCIWGRDPVWMTHAWSLRAALVTGEMLEVTDPGESEDVGVDWADPRALISFGDREATEPWSWHGVERSVTGNSWGGCLEVIEWILAAGRFPADPGVIDGGVLIIETSEELLPARNVGWIVRALGERGILSAVDAVLVARPPASDFTRRPRTEERARLRAEQRDVVVNLIGRYNPDAVICVPFGHTRPQWIVPHGGAITVDGTTHRVSADYS